MKKLLTALGVLGLVTFSSNDSALVGRGGRYMVDAGNHLDCGSKWSSRSVLGELSEVERKEARIMSDYHLDMHDACIKEAERCRSKSPINRAFALVGM